MTSFLIEFLNVIVAFLPGYGFRYYPMWKTRNWKTRSVVIFLVCNTVFQFAGLMAFKRLDIGMEIWALNLLKASLSLPQIIVPFFVFKKRVWENIFLLSVSIAYAPVSTGIGNFAVGHWRFFALSPFAAANIASLVVIAVTLPPLLRILRRLFENPSIGQMPSFWRFFWILPLLFFGIIILTNSFYAGIATPQSASFLIVRVLIYAALLLICALLDAAVRQVHETEAVRLRAEELAAKTDFYHRMSHDMLTPLTRVSTNIQVAKMKPEKAAELLTEAQGDIMRMAGMINDALNEGNNAPSDKEGGL
jgi:signal transduction histidine kinase